jgi:predicted outer membrane repeat protein
MRIVSTRITLFCILILLPAVVMAQTTHIVTSLEDDGSGGLTLREAIAAASPGDSIEFAVSGTITLNSTLSINKNITIDGPGARSLIVDADATGSAFSISSACVVSGLTVQNGVAVNGGGFNITVGNVTIRNCRIINNSATGQGGGIYHNEVSFDQLNIENCEISGNAATLGGGICSNSILVVDSSTIFGNSGDGAAAYIYSSAAISSFANCTIVNNFPSSGSAAFYAASTAIVLLENSIIANNPNNSTPDFKESGTSPTVQSSGYNVITNDADNVVDITDTGDTIGTGVSPLTINTPALAFNGGQTRTSAIIDVLVNSRVVVGTHNMPDYDQNYRSRVGLGDIGAHQLGGFIPADIEVKAIVLQPETTTHDDSVVFKAQLTMPDGAASFGVEYSFNSSFSPSSTNTESSNLTQDAIVSSPTLNLGYNNTVYTRAFATNSNGTYFYSEPLSVTLPDVPDIAVRGDNLNYIDDGDATPRTADGTDFGIVRVNTTSTKTYKIFNTGSTTLNFASIIMPSGFSIGTAPPGSIASLGNANLQINYTPTSIPNTSSGNVSIASNDPNESPFTFAITATAGYSSIAITGNGNAVTDGGTAVSPTNNTDFGSQNLTSGAKQKTFTITNSGNLASTLVVGIANNSASTRFRSIP